MPKKKPVNRRTVKPAPRPPSSPNLPAPAVPAVTPQGSSDRALLAACLICLAAIAFLFYRYNRLKPAGDTAATGTAENRQRLNAAPKDAEWKTFRNDVFEFSYPPSLDLIDKSVRNDQRQYQGVILMQNFDVYNRLPADRGRFQTVIFLEPDPGIPLETYAENQQIGSLEKTTVGGQAALKGIQVEKTQRTPVLIFLKDGALYTIALSIPTSLNAAWFERIYQSFTFRK